MIAFLFSHAVLPLIAAPLSFPAPEDSRTRFVPLEPPAAVEARETLQLDESPASSSESTPMCPRPRPYHGLCAQVIVWARHPGTGVCCFYATPCNAPPSWKQYPSREACQATPRGPDSR
jgi:hypothetical protein